MPQSLAQIYLHVVFSTKHREPLLADRELRCKTHAYMVGICRNLGSPSLIIGGTDDHVHLLCTFSRTSAVSDFVRELKRDSSKWVKTKNASLAGFHWQDGYGAFSVSPSHVPALKDYIASQDEHHKQEAFEGEYLRLLAKYGVEYDERFVWE
jgi:putative transposase